VVFAVLCLVEITTCVTSLDSLRSIFILLYLLTFSTLNIGERKDCVFTIQCIFQKSEIFDGNTRMNACVIRKSNYRTTIQKLATAECNSPPRQIVRTEFNGDLISNQNFHKVFPNLATDCGEDERLGIQSSIDFAAKHSAG